MPPDGIETLAKWREAGEWWKDEPPVEIHRFIDPAGIRRETITPLEFGGQVPASDIRVRRLRDEKIRLASGRVIPPSYGRGTRHDSPSVLLYAQSGYSICQGTMLAAEIPAFAAERGFGSALLADRFSLSGAFEFCGTAKQVGIKPLIGATLEMDEGGEIVLVAKNQAGYRSLSRLISACHLEEPRQYPLCTWARLERHCEGLLCLAGSLVEKSVIRRDWVAAESTLKHFISIYGYEDVFLQLERTFLPWQNAVEPRLLELAEECGIRCVAGGPILHERRDHFPAHDVLVCIDSLCLIDEIEGRKPRRAPGQAEPALAPRRSLNAERFMRSAKAQQAIFADRPDLIENARLIAERCEANVMPPRAELPPFCENEPTALRELVTTGAFARYGKVTGRLKRRIDHELARMAKLGWSRHFLIAWDMCEWARSQDILFGARGSAVDSVVTYCLGISRVDAFEFNLHFDRFLPPDGSKRPDIDIDFEAARREDVRQYLVGKYGDDHVATVAAVGTFCTRGIIREVGKVMGIPEQSISYLAKKLHGGVTPERLQTALDDRPELRDSGIPRERFQWVFKLAERLMDLPRNLRAHSSGVVISEQPITDYVPVMHSAVEEVKIMQWDKRSAKKCFDKFDVLCLRGNDVLGGTERRVAGLDVKDLPLDDPEVFRTMRSGELIGIPQSASPAMRQAHIRIQTQNFKDAAIVQAGIRPGVGGAVKLNEYISRRRGKPFRFVHEDVEKILGPTLGIVVFQEQIDQLLETFGGYSGDEAEEIREAIQKHHGRGYEGEVRRDVFDRILARGYARQVAGEVYELIAGFKGYGFAEGHALSFAEISIRSIYCQQNYPAPYFAALLDAQPAGYYGPVTICNEARVRGVKILPPDVNLSAEKFGVEDVKSVEDPQLIFPDGGIRVPLSQVGGLSLATRERALAQMPYESFFDFVVRVAPARDELEALILCGAFDGLHSNRRSLLWAIPSAMDHGYSLRGGGDVLPLRYIDPPLPEVADLLPLEKAIWERRILGLDVEKHLMAFERERVFLKGGLSSAEASRLAPGKSVFVVGNPIRLRFPPTQSGKRVLFFDLEDETGLLNVTCFDDVYQRDGHKVVCHPFITLWGDTEDRDGHLSFMAHRMYAYTPGSLDAQREIPIITADFMMR